MDKQYLKSKHQELLSQGWLRRFSGEGPRLEEMKEFYRSLGFETLIVDGMVGDEGACTSCFDVPGFEERYKTLYTRGESAKSSSEDDMF